MFLCVFEKLYSLNNVINWVYLYFIFFCCHKQVLALIMAGVYIREFKSFLCSIQLAVRIPAIFVIKRAWIECLLTWASPTDSLKNYAMNFFYDDKKNGSLNAVKINESKGQHILAIRVNSKMLFMCLFSRLWEFIS